MIDLGIEPTECPWCYAEVLRSETVHLWDPATLACEIVCVECNERYWREDRARILAEGGE